MTGETSPGTSPRPHDPPPIPSLAELCRRRDRLGAEIDDHLRQLRAPERGTRTAMHRECGATTQLPPALAVRALRHLRRLAATGTGTPRDLLVETDLHCFLEAHEDGEHHGLVADTDDGAPDVWTTWSDGSRPASLTHLLACPADNGEADGRHDVCCLFVHHPGRCTFDLVGPESEAPWLPGNRAGWPFVLVGEPDG